MLTPEGVREELLWPARRALGYEILRSEIVEGNVRKRRNRYSGIGGQAVLEGIMMKNGEQYAIAVRKPDGEIEVDVDTYHSVIHGSRL